MTWLLEQELAIYCELKVPFGLFSGEAGPGLRDRWCLSKTWVGEASANITSTLIQIKTREMSCFSCVKMAILSVNPGSPVFLSLILNLWRGTEFQGGGSDSWEAKRLRALVHSRLKCC